MSADATLINAREIGMTYKARKGADVVALDRLSIDVARGEFLSIVGRSGCGKSTLLSIIGGLTNATHGEVLIDGEPVTSPRRDIGYVFQNPVLLPWKTALENVMLPIAIAGGDRVTAQERAEELLAMVGLDGFQNKYPSELSGGMQQRTSLVRALMHDPAILLMDEPFGALDALTREQLNMDIQRIWLEARKTVVFVTHSITEAVFLADRVVVLAARPGRIAEIVRVDQPRPRSYEWTTSESFGVHARVIRRALGV